MGVAFAHFFEKEEFKVDKSYGEITPHGWQVCFTPKGHCSNLILNEIKNAKHTILVHGYSFTSKLIAIALVNAHHNGIQVKIILDKGQRTDPHSQYAFLKDKGIQIFFDDVSGLSHNKVMIIDNETVITGSYNWTNAAEKRNAENIIILKQKELALKYTENWLKRAKQVIIQQKNKNPLDDHLTKG